MKQPQKTRTGTSGKLNGLYLADLSGMVKQREREERGGRHEGGRWRGKE